MTRSVLRLSVCLLLFAGTGPFLASCKDKKKSEPIESTAPPATTAPIPPPPAPVVISADDSLKTSVVDATKDFPGVSASIANGEITLTGNIERSKLPTLIKSLQALRPKKINNELIIK